MRGEKSARYVKTSLLSQAVAARLVARLATVASRRLLASIYNLRFNSDFNLRVAAHMFVCIN